MIPNPEPGERVLFYPKNAEPPILAEYLGQEGGWVHVRVPDWDIRWVPGIVGPAPEIKRVFVGVRAPQTRIVRRPVTARRLELARSRMGLTFRQVTEKTGIGPRVIRQHERDGTGLDSRYLHLYAACFGVTAVWFFGETPEEEVNDV